MLRTKEHFQRQKLVEEPKQNTNVESLHQILQNETEKIVRWKVSTEVELHQKERLLENCEKQVKKLQVNLRKEQMTSENLSHALNKEKESRQILDTKVLATRSVCDSLYNQQEELKLTLDQCVALRQHVTSNNERISTNIDELSNHLNHLTIDHQQFSQKIQAKVETEIQDLTEEKRSLCGKVDDLTNNLDETKKNLDSKTNELNELIVNNTQATAQITILEEHKEILQIAFDELKGEYASMECKMNEELGKMKELLSQLQETLKQELEKNRINEESLAEAKEKIESQENTIKELEEASKDLELKIENLKVEKEESQKEMANLLDQYKRENETILQAKEKEMDTLKYHLQEVKNSLQQTTELKDNLEQDKITLEKKLATQVAEHLKLKNDIQSLTVPKTPPVIRNDSQLKTPSPSTYLPLYRRPTTAYRHRTPQRPEERDATQKSSILKPRRGALPKSVSFRSPVYMNPPDSDSSDAAPFEIGNDVDDIFEIPNRKSSKLQASVIPQVRVTPVCNDSSKSNKRIRIDKSNMRTYFSPKEKNVGNKSPKLTRRETRSSKTADSDPIFG